MQTLIQKSLNRLLPFLAEKRMFSLKTHVGGFLETIDREKKTKIAITKREQQRTNIRR